ncbi:hypothetical protein Ccrd_020521 [Cynara cardunculus var. scolymus]|uniref:Transmembrane protein n=1 Tax=Cynara cardunculus var. scolymus TaxID=59895 RepID=A0A103Y2A7_CYNCS|nr:hypothetical protein Ccrd_020521 [Cynara cardunculus var. scolymus]
MKRLARKWKNGSDDDEEDDDGKSCLPTSSDFHPMDTEEQEELVRSLERSLAQQSRFWRRVFAGLHCCFVAFLIFSIHGQTTMPWELRYHAYFMDEIESWTVIAAEWAAVFVSFMAVAGLLRSSRSQRRWLWFSCCFGALLAAADISMGCYLASFRSLEWSRVFALRRSSYERIIGGS